MTGVYGINSPKKLFEHLKRKVSIYSENPTDEYLTDVLFPLIHLREWVYPDGRKRLKKLPEQLRTREELLFEELYKMHEFGMMLSLFNKAKHFKDKGNTPVMSSVQNARAGLMRCGDRLDRKYHLVNGGDIREYFSAVIKLYKAYFDGTPE